LAREFNKRMILSLSLNSSTLAEFEECLILKTRRPHAYISFSPKLRLQIEVTQRKINGKKLIRGRESEVEQGAGRRAMEEVARN
jgi:hypothetical protein